MARVLLFCNPICYFTCLWDLLFVEQPASRISPWEYSLYDLMLDPACLIQLHNTYVRMIADLLCDNKTPPKL